MKPAWCGALLAMLLAVAPAASAATAKEMYAAALVQQRLLHEKSDAAPALARYRRVADAFEAVVRRHPTTGYADNALWEAAHVAAEAAERFDSARDRDRAVRLLTLLVEEYPASPLRGRARDEIKRLDRPAPVQPAKTKAQSTGRSPADVPARGDEDDPSGSTSAAAEVAQAKASQTPSPLPILREIRREAMDDIVRVTIELSDEVVYRTERVENPSRVLFDLSGTRLGPGLSEGTLSYPGEVVRHVRIGRHPNRVTRVVLDLEGVKRYSVFTLYTPYRIVVDCEREGVSASRLERETVREEPVVLPPPPPPDPPPVLESRPLRSRIAVRIVSPSAVVPPPAAAPVPLPAPVAVVSSLKPIRDFAPHYRRLNALLPAVRIPVPLLPPDPSAVVQGADTAAPAFGASTLLPAPAAAQPVADRAAAVPTTRPPARVERAADKAATPAERLVERKAPAAPSPRPERPSAPAPPAPAPPAPTDRGNYSLARQLGLGASRIVIDPGHGGHDPGAEGAGAFEAKLVLDVALRLERLLLAAGSEVVLTRRTDEYIPLEERTALANRAQGDLFLSIHANASRNRAARGVETYFLNFATSPDAEAVAARENASTGRTMSSLTDIVKAIALNNKLNESRSFAGLVQQQMVDHLKGSNKGLKDHGVKQAPFVVLIGASMPSVLVEISFITNNQEGRLLKSAAYRQKVAEALADAVRGYQKSLKNGVAVTHQSQ